MLIHKYHSTTKRFLADAWHTASKDENGNNLPLPDYHTSKPVTKGLLQPAYKNSEWVEDATQAELDARNAAILITKIQAINFAVQANLATLIKSYKFTDSINYSKYVGYSNDFKVIAEALGAYEAQVWTYCEAEIIKLELGTRSMPAIDDFILELPIWSEPI